MTTRLFTTLEEIAELFFQFGEEWALVGGLAVSAYVEPRFTRDIYVVVSVEGDGEAEAFVQIWRNAGFAIASVVEQERSGRLATIRSHRPGDEHRIVVDLMFASSGIEPEIAAEARDLELAPNLDVPVARPGHLVALKILSADPETRPQDELDLQQLVALIDEKERQSAQQGLRLIEQRGYHRGRDLQKRLDDILGDESS